jgi:hypothetical protein
MIRPIGALVTIGAVFAGCVACAGSPSTQSATGTTTATTAASATLAPDQVGSAVTTAYEGASSVHAKGSVTESSGTITIDVQLNKDSAAGTIGQGDTTIPMMWVGNVYYFKFTAAVLKMAGASATTSPGNLMKDKWVSSDSKLAAGMVGGFKDFLSYDTFLPKTAGLTKSASFAAAGTDTVDGVPVLVFHSVDGSAVDVSATSPHYLTRMSGPTSNPGSFDFTGWNQPVPISAPPANQMYSGPGA